MPNLHWQKSTYSQEASACVYLAAYPTGTILLHESNEPESILTTGRDSLAALIAVLRSPGSLNGPHSVEALRGTSN